MGTAGGAFSERAVRCPRAQRDGGVILMSKGAVLFDGVAISSSEENVRIGGQRCASGPMREGGAEREAAWTEAVADVARVCAVSRRCGLHERRGSHVQGRHDHHGVGGAHWARCALA
jgi:hypothetical protein